jgi:hypothetical protein
MGGFSGEAGEFVLIQPAKQAAVDWWLLQACPNRLFPGQ